MLAQDVGYSQQCCRLITIASQICGVLRGCDLTTLTSSSEEVTQAFLNFIKCYIFDRILSATMHRAPSAIEMDLNPLVLTTENPVDAAVNIMFDFARVQDAMIQESQARGVKDRRQSELEKYVTLKCRVKQIRTKINEVCRSLRRGIITG